MPKPLHNEQYRTFLDLLRKVRGEKGLTQVQLAGLLGEEQTFVSKCETGIRRLDIIELRLWLQSLDTNLAEFTASLDERLSSQLHEHTRRSRTAKPVAKATSQRKKRGS